MGEDILFEFVGDVDAGIKVRIFLWCQFRHIILYVVFLEAVVPGKVNTFVVGDCGFYF